MIEIRVLGRAVVERDGSLVRGRAVQNHHLALLAFLATAPGRTASRDRLIGLLWPDSEAGRARHRLSVALHAIRKGLGKDAILTHGDAVVLNPNVVWTDAGEFLDAVDSGKLREAVTLCRGPFLDGFYLKEGLNFERWVERERDRLAGLCRSALEQLAEGAEADGHYSSAVGWRRRIATQAPYESSATLALMESMVAAGDVAGAIARGRSYVTHVEGNLGIPVHPRVLDRLDELEEVAQEREGAGGDRTGAAGWKGDEATSEGASLSAPETVRRPGTPGPIEADRGLGQVVTLAAGGIMAIAAIWAMGGQPEVPVAGGPASVVVLPFQGLGSAESSPVGELLAEEIAATLSVVPNLDVRDVPDVSGSAGVDPRRAARGARATFAVTGTVSHEGGRAEVTAALVHGASVDVQWEGTFTRELGSTDALVEALSMAVADELRTRVARYVPHHYTDSESANDAFLTAVYQHRRFNEESIWVALQHYRRGWEEDPDFALAHAIAGTAYMSLSQNFGLTPEVGWERGREHVMRAIAIDPTLPEAYSVLGRLQLFWDRDFEAAEATLRRAIMLYPTHPDARTWYAFYQLYYLQDFGAAVDNMRRSLELDPLNTARSRDVETALFQARRFEEVEAQRRHTESLDPDVAASVRNYRLADAYREMGMYSEAVEEYHAVQAHRAGPVPIGLGVTYARMGRIQDARAVLREHEARLGPEGPRGSAMAQLYAALGQTDRALEVLDAAVTANPGSQLHLATNPGFDALRADPRFNEVLRRIGLVVD